MGIGDVWQIETGTCTDLYAVDVGMYGVSEYASVYVIDDERPAIVETGLGNNPALVLDALEAVGIDREDLSVIALTHVHLDHAGGANQLAEACPNATVVVYERGAPHLADPAALVAGTKQVVGDLWKYYHGPDPIPDDRIRTVTDGDTVDLGDHVLDVYHAPGHANHQVLFDDPANDAVFVGDAVGSYFPGLDAVRQITPPPEFDFQQNLDDLNLLRELDRETLLFSHFGAHPARGKLDAYESVLASWVAGIAQARQAAGSDKAVLKQMLEQNVTPDNWHEDLRFGETRTNVSGVLTYLDIVDEVPLALAR
jgi:glyoxylase-like metal-dependent hydrolase (beta-lactamase superfamily II)